MGAEIFVLQAGILKAMGHPTRVRIVDSLRGGERCVCEIVAELQLEQANISQHLAVLRRAGILAMRKDGMMVMYRVRCPQMFQLLDILREMIVRQVQEQLRVLSHLKPDT